MSDEELENDIESGKITNVVEFGCSKESTTCCKCSSAIKQLDFIGKERDTGNYLCGDCSDIPDVVRLEYEIAALKNRKLLSTENGVNIWNKKNPNIPLEEIDTSPNEWLKAKAEEEGKDLDIFKT